MTGAFRVADHIFHLDMPGGHPLWMRMAQYTPFMVASDSEPLFTLKLVENLEYVPLSPLFVNMSAKDGQPGIDLYAVEGGVLAELAPCAGAPEAGKLVMLDGYRRGEFSITGDRQGAFFALNNSLMLMFAFATAPLMTLEMHSSVIANHGSGYLFLGSSGTGKSTHSRLWLKNIEGSELLNDDNPILRVCADGKVRVYGSPWSGKTPCYRNTSVPVAAIVRIRQAAENKIARMNVLEAYASVYSSCSGFKSDKGIADALHRTIEYIAVHIPNYTMECLPDDAAARICADELL